jgi:hypothetical protein
MKSTFFFGPQKHIYILITCSGRLGGVVVSVLATGPKGCGFKTRPKRWIFKGDKSHTDEQTKLSFPVAHLVVKSGVSPSRCRLLTRSYSPSIFHPCRWTNHPHRVLKRFIETKVTPGTPDAVMAQTGTGKKKKNYMLR